MEAIKAGCTALHQTLQPAKSLTALHPVHIDVEPRHQPLDLSLKLTLRLYQNRNTLWQLTVRGYSAGILQSRDDSLELFPRTQVAGSVLDC